MNEKELTELIEKGEDSFTEFKEEKAHSNDLAAEIVAFANTEGGKILLGISDKKEIKGVTNPDKEMLRVENISRNNCEPSLTVNIEKIKTRVNIKGFENELKPEIPKEVLREVVVNAVAHRDYHITSQIRIFIFDNRLEIMSPGKLPNGITLENIKLGVHSERNPLIVSYLAKWAI